MPHPGTTKKGPKTLAVFAATTGCVPALLICEVFPTRIALHLSERAVFLAALCQSATRAPKGPQEIVTLLEMIARAARDSPARLPVAEVQSAAPPVPGPTPPSPPPSRLPLLQHQGIAAFGAAAQLAVTLSQVVWVGRQLLVDHRPPCLQRAMQAYVTRARCTLTLAKLGRTYFANPLTLTPI